MNKKIKRIIKSLEVGVIWFLTATALSFILTIFENNILLKMIWVIPLTIVMLYGLHLVLGNEE